MAVYSIDVRIYGTAYIKARSEAEARKKLAKAIKDDSGQLHLADDAGGSEDLPVCGRQFDDPELPAVSLSPAMTVVGPDKGTRMSHA